MSSAPLYDPYIVVPPFTSCEDSYLLFGQGTPPYTLSVIGSGDSNWTVIETLPRQSREGALKWKVDFNEGANIGRAPFLSSGKTQESSGDNAPGGRRFAGVLTFVLTDASNKVAYSQYRVVQAGEVSTCPKTDYSATHHSVVGPAVGGALGGAACLALLVLSLWYLRKRRQRREAEGQHKEKPRARGKEEC
ncbi:hypothetical protein JCM6882_004101 [Rhodosporidiobolus microsporus]